jgi:hypothetical protein
MDYGKTDCPRPGCDATGARTNGNESQGLSLEAQAQMAVIVSDAMDKALERYGVNIQNPHAQQMDLKYLYNQRVTSERIAQHSRTALITVFFTGLLSMVLWIVRQAFKLNGSG